MRMCWLRWGSEEEEEVPRVDAWVGGGVVADWLPIHRLLPLQLQSFFLRSFFMQKW